MSYHFRPFAYRCDICKNATARVEIYNAVNARLGKFCQACGRRRMRELEQADKAVGK